MNQYLKGFTLIEAIIYIALFAIIIGGGLAASYQIIQSTDAAQNHVILQQEANFIFRKIEWALTGATAVNTPNTYTLGVTKGSLLTFTQNTGSLTLQRASDSSVILNSSSVIVNLFSVAKIVGSGGKPDSVKVDFTLTLAQSGMPTTQSFSFIKYLRK